IENKEKKERRVKVSESRHNCNYKSIMTEKLPKYLEGKRKRKDKSLIDRYRCESETKGSQYWREVEDRSSRIYLVEEESIFHILKECEETKNELRTEKFIGEEGRGLETMKKIGKTRK
ncbi:hypothetical protein ALC57_03857, partial [Trachymyrmex cornetzi]